MTMTMMTIQSVCMVINLLLVSFWGGVYEFAEKSTKMDASPSKSLSFVHQHKSSLCVILMTSSLVCLLHVCSCVFPVRP